MVDKEYIESLPRETRESSNYGSLVWVKLGELDLACRSENSLGGFMEWIEGELVLRQKLGFYSARFVKFEGNNAYSQLEVWAAPAVLNTPVEGSTYWKALKKPRRIKGIGATLKSIGKYLVHVRKYPDNWSDSKV